jgi:NADPH-dependent F420 reductase
VEVALLIHNTKQESRLSNKQMEEAMLAFLGGTGAEGKGLALRFAIAGEQIIIGSRDANRAAAAATHIRQLAPSACISGSSNFDAAKLASVIFLTVPYRAQESILRSLKETLAGKVVVSTIVPIAFTRRSPPKAIETISESAAKETQDLLPNSLVVGAFQNVSAVILQQQHQVVKGDTVVCSDSIKAKILVMELVRKIPDLRPVDGGRLANSEYVEHITFLLANINQIYQVNAGIRIIGL